MTGAKPAYFPTGRALLGAGVITLALALAGCGPDKGADGSAAIGPDTALAASPWPGDTQIQSNEPPLPEAQPMREAPPAAHHASNYAAAPRYFEADKGYGSSAEYYNGPVSTNDYDTLALAAVVGGVLASSPPDYGFDYDGVRPWAWETGDGYARYAEPIGDGYRDYYYAPDASRPFLIRDPYYSYGYRDGQLVNIYGRDGRLVDMRSADRQRVIAQRYYDRAMALRSASESEQHEGVEAQLWAQHRASFSQAQADWDRGRSARPQWRAWDQRHDPVIAARWTQEHVVRQYAGQRFAHWQQADFRSAPPRFYQEAARDRALRQTIRTQRAEAIREVEGRRGSRQREDQSRVAALQAAQSQQQRAQQSQRSAQAHQAQARQAAMRQAQSSALHKSNRCRRVRQR